MKSITVYIDESLSNREMVKLKRDIMTLPHVLDVEHPRHDEHNLTIDYDAANVPQQIMETLRARGLHPDVISG